MECVADAPTDSGKSGAAVFAENEDGFYLSDLRRTEYIHPISSLAFLSLSLSLSLSLYRDRLDGVRRRSRPGSRQALAKGP
jgi:hypothetical protein